MKRLILAGLLAASTVSMAKPFAGGISNETLDSCRPLGRIDGIHGRG